MPRVEPWEDRNPFYRVFYQYQGSAVAGTWAWEHNSDQTNYAAVTQISAGIFLNTTATDLDEYTWGAIALTKGQYNINFNYATKYASGGIGEILLGNTSLKTQDMYATSNNYNQSGTISFVLTENINANLRFRANDKNTSSTAYIVNFSRFSIEKTG